MKSSENTNEIASALSKMQGVISCAKLDKVNPFFKSKYANLASVWEALQAPMTSNGLCYVQDVVTVPEGVAVTTRIMHASGQYIEFGPLVIPLMKKEPHAVGSATSYAKRYALSAAFGIVADDEDDDGNRAQVSHAQDLKKRNNQSEQHQQHVERPVEKPKVIPLTQEETDLWLDDLYTKGFDPKLVDDFLSNSSKRFARDVKELCAGFSKNHDSFCQKFNYWMENKN